MKQANGENIMKIKDLIEILKKHDENNNVIFYNLQNHDLTEYNLESIIDCNDIGQTEITTTKEDLE
jgi:hypothetical protein